MRDRFLGFHCETRHSIIRAIIWSAAILMLAVGCLAGGPARADHSTFRTYDADQGLTSLSGACLSQDRAGSLLICTEHGLFAYDGRRFVNFGTAQGLRQGGAVNDEAVTAAGRVAVGFADEVFVSDRPSDPSHPPGSLSFKAVLHPGLSFYSEKSHRLAAWRDGLVLLAGHALVSVAVPPAGSPHVETMDYDREEQRLLDDASTVFSVHGRLWETFADGRLCAADPGAVTCYAAAAGLRGGPWMDVAAGPDGRVLARSASSVGTFDPASGRWSVVDLPDQGGRYANYPDYLGLFRTPDGGLVTQADHGLAVLGPDGWRVLTVDDGAPSGTIMRAMTDATGQLWFQILGRGLVRWVGYGHWETLQKVDGLSDGLPWQTVRPDGGSMWVSTDTGVDEVVRRGSSLRIARVIPGGSFAIATGRHGELWSSDGTHGVKIIDPVNGAVAEVATPSVNAIVAGGDGVWLATEAGLLRVEDRPPFLPVLEGSPRTPVVGAVSDGRGGVFYLSGGRLRHRKEHGIDVAMAGPWPGGGFEPVSIAVDRDRSLWIGGPGGLFHVILSADRVSSYQAVPAAETQTNSLVAVTVDRRGWVWVGTALGVSVFDGIRWVSVDTDRGLLSDDISQNGIREDPDGSMWIATTQGLSHLLDPGWLFSSHPIKAVVSEALLGSRPVVGRTMPYTNDALTVQFGTPNYGAERSILFRYRLSGVDARWVETSSGSVRYPFVPPGRHLMTVVGVDALTHQSSPPTTLMVSVAFPWWRQWWSETLAGLGVPALAYGVMRLRLRAMMAKQAELTRLVAEATEGMRVTQARLRHEQAQLQHQAAHDSLTSLLNRREIERRLASRLSAGNPGDEMVVALLDIDHFKRVNDHHGHLGGDDVLRALGRLVSASIRDGEDAGRYGGEEILLVLDDADGRGAERVLDLHHAVRREPFDAAGTAIRVTCSIGLAWAVAGDNWESLIGRADEALYDAKEDGRDRVVESRRVETGASTIPAEMPRPDQPTA